MDTHAHRTAGSSAEEVELRTSVDHKARGPAMPWVAEGTQCLAGPDTHAHTRVGGSGEEALAEPVHKGRSCPEIAATVRSDLGAGLGHKGHHLQGADIEHRPVVACEVALIAQKPAVEDRQRRSKCKGRSPEESRDLEVGRPQADTHHTLGGLVGMDDLGHLSEGDCCIADPGCCCRCPAEVDDGEDPSRRRVDVGGS